MYFEEKIFCRNGVPFNCKEILGRSETRKRSKSLYYKRNYEKINERDRLYRAKVKSGEKDREKEELALAIANIEARKSQIRIKQILEDNAEKEF